MATDVNPIEAFQKFADAVEHVKSCGYSDAAATAVVQREGYNAILEHKSFVDQPSDEGTGASSVSPATPAVDASAAVASVPDATGDSTPDTRVPCPYCGTWNEPGVRCICGRG